MTPREVMAAKVAEIITGVSGESFSPGLDEDLIQFGLDSLDTVSVILECEEEFGVAIPDGLLDNTPFNTINQIVNLIETCNAAPAEQA